MKFVCIRKCQYHSSIFSEGETIDVNTIVKCPFCKGEGCPKCGKTGRSDPPHHFKPVEVEKPVEYVDAPLGKEVKDETSEEVIEEAGKVMEEDSSEIDKLRAQFEAKGKAFDRRWGVKKLKDELKRVEKEG